MGLFSGEIPLFLLFGFLLISGYLVSRLFQGFGVPQVIGYVLLGLLAGESVLNVLNSETLQTFAPLTDLALAMIGFLVGGELKKSIFVKYGKSYFAILFFEGILSMLFVTGVVWVLLDNIPLAILLGALASATAPAATVDVIWEYKSRGPLTSTILAIVALDDGLSLFLYGFAMSLATVMVAGGDFSTGNLLLTPLIELGGAAALGIGGGFFADLFLGFVKNREQKLVIILGTLLSVCGLANQFHLSLILTAMVMGSTLTNWKVDRHQDLFDMIQKLSPPIYLFFFVFAGARLRPEVIPGIGLVGVAYIFFRYLGKSIGSWIGGNISGSPPVVTRYLGLALFSQAGVAIGLSIDVYEKFQTMGKAAESMGHQVMNIIAATTLVVQLIGPPLVKLALSKAGEIPEETKS